MVRYLALIAFTGMVGFAQGGVPAVVSLIPSTGTGAGRSFSFVYSDSDGGADIAMVEATVVSGAELTGRHACNFYAGGNRVWLRDDGDTAWLGPVAAGTPTTLRNSQCGVAAASLSLAPSGHTLTMNVAVTFTTSFVGAKTIFAKATDRSGFASEWTQLGAWSVTPLNPGLEVVTSSCADRARDGEYAIRIFNPDEWRLFRMQMTPDCYPVHTQYMAKEGWFLDDGRPLPVMGRTVGHFDVLFVYLDSEINRQKLLDNPTIPAAAKAKVAAGEVTAALTELLATYTPAAVMAGVRPQASAVVDFSYTVALTNASRRSLLTDDAGLGFARYDAVVLVNDLGTSSGMGVVRWPSGRHLFDAAGGGITLNLDPQAMTPALFGRELLGRNLPGWLSEYVMGEPTLVVENGVTYDRTPVTNPRTGENIEPLIRSYEGKTPVATYIGGYADVDGDGVIDCIDPEITPTADNADGDFIPDRLDPDLRLNHRPYSWLYTDRGGRAP